MKRTAFKYIVPILIIALILVIGISVIIGRFSISPKDLWLLLTGEGTAATATVFFTVRLPRIAAALLIGAGLSVSGAADQGTFKNPWVSPDILGASAGASFGAVLGILINASALMVQLLSFFFGLTAVMITYIIGRLIERRQGSSLLLLVLTGMVVSAIFTAFVSIVKYVADPYDVLPTITFWLMGGLTYVTSSDVLVMLIPFLIGIIPLLALRWRLNVLSMGREEAAALGVNTQGLMGSVILFATLLTSSSVAIGGMIGWIGLLIPHLARMLVGPDYKRLLPVALLMGSLFLLIVDNLARSLFPQELPLGVLTAIIGAPFFLYLLFHGRKGFV